MIAFAKLNRLLTEKGSSNSSLNRYNENLKSVHKIYKDIKRTYTQNLSISDLI